MLPQGIRKITVQFLILAVLTSSAVFGVAAFGSQWGSPAATAESPASSPIPSNAFVANSSSQSGLLADSDLAGETNLTDALASTMALQVAKSNPDGPTTDAQGQLGFSVPSNIDSILAQSMSGSAPSEAAIMPQIAATSIKVQKNYTVQDISNYMLALAPVIQAQGDATYLAALGDDASSSPDALAVVNSSIAQLEDSLLVAPVPEPFFKFHVSLLNMLDTQSKLVALTSTDPMRALLLLNQAQALLARENVQIGQNIADVENNLPSIKAGLQTADASPALNARLAEFFSLGVPVAHAQAAAGGLVGGLSSGLIGCATTLWPMIGGLIDRVGQFFGFSWNIGGGPGGATKAAADAAALAVKVAAENAAIIANAAKSVPISSPVQERFDFPVLVTTNQSVNSDVQTNQGTQMTATQNYCQQLLDYLKKLGTQLLINDLINRMQKAIVAWATGGDPLKAALSYGAGGGAKFVTNWKQFADMAFNNAVGAVIQQIEPKLCSPFAPYLKVVLTPVQTGTFSYPTCTLDSVLNNVHSAYGQFVNNFTSGGMIAYVQAIQPQNNLLGSYILASDEATIAGAAAQLAATNQALAGGGYKGTTACISTHIISGQKSIYASDPNTVSIDSCGADGFCNHIVVCDSLDDWKLTNPGSTIGAVVAKSFTSTIDRIINAQDLQSLFSFAMSSLLSKLLGSESSNSSGNVGGDPGLLYGNLSSSATSTSSALCSNFSPGTQEYKDCTRQVDDTSVYCQQYQEGTDAYNSCISTYQGILNGTTTAAQRLELPMDPVAPPANAVYATNPATFAKPGKFFTAANATSSAGVSRMEFSLPVDPNKNYHSLTADFDMHISDFSGGAFNGVVVDLNRKNPQKDPAQRGYMAAWITLLNSDTKGIRTNIDTLDNRFNPTPDAWTANTNYHIHLVYDTTAATVTMGIQNTDSGTALKPATSAVSNTDLRDTGGGIQIGFGLEGPADGGAYIPPYGWSFSNLQVAANP